MPSHSLWLHDSTSIILIREDYLMAAATFVCECVLDERDEQIVFCLDFLKIREILKSRSEVRRKNMCVWVSVCHSGCRCVFQVCVCVCGCVLGWGVRHRWTAGVSVVLNHSPLPSIDKHTYTHTRAHMHTPSPINHTKMLLKVVPALTHCSSIMPTYIQTYHKDRQKKSNMSVW